MNIFITLLTAEKSNIHFIEIKLNLHEKINSKKMKHLYFIM